MWQQNLNRKWQCMVQTIFPSTDISYASPSRACRSKLKETSRRGGKTKTGSRSGFYRHTFMLTFIEKLERFTNETSISLVVRLLSFLIQVAITCV
jgi:hypothetical protein